MSGTRTPSTSFAADSGSWTTLLDTLTRTELTRLRHGIRNGSFPLSLEEADLLYTLNPWQLHARPAQLEPDGDWRVWYVSGGRGSGKTRTGAETLAAWIRRYHDDGLVGDWAVVAPTFGDARDVCIEGPSGLLRALGGRTSPYLKPDGWNRSHGELWLSNGNRVFCDGASDGAFRVQGKNLRGAWTDEIGLWQKWPVAWHESLSFAVRLDPARIVATGTPKQGHGLVKHLLGSPAAHVTRMRLLDNLANLHPDAVDELVRQFEGTRLGRQELEGEFLEDVPGALWTLDLIDRSRVEVAPHLDRIVIGVDPSGAADDDTGSNSIGIVACGFSAHLQRAYVLADVTVRAGPETWANKVVALYHQLRADLVVAERNFGGDMVRATIHAADRNIPVRLETSSRGKRLRAEPVALKYDQDLVCHVGHLSELEAQMTSWVPDHGMDSPDRLDALVFALNELLIAGGRVTGHAPESRGMSEPVVRRGDLVLRGQKYVDR